MIIILSPSKTMDFSPYTFSEYTQPDFIDAATSLNKLLKKFSMSDLSSLLGTSEKLTQQSFDQIMAFTKEHTADNAKPAILAFTGDVYGGLGADTLSKPQLSAAAKQIIILSGLYGALRGSDLILPYRLDISAPIPTAAGKTLYPFWKNNVSQFVNQYAHEENADFIFNLASDEYAKAIDWKVITKPVVTAEFLEERNGIRKVISFSAKKARGTLTRMILSKNITTVAAIKKCVVDDFVFDKNVSSDNHLVFVKVV